jgi:hypothetical protein
MFCSEWEGGWDFFVFAILSFWRPLRLLLQIYHVYENQYKRYTQADACLDSVKMTCIPHSSIVHTYITQHFPRRP